MLRRRLGFISVVVITAVTGVCLAASAWRKTGIDDKNWILDTGAKKAPLSVTKDACPSDTRRARGAMRQDDPKRGSVQDMQSRACTRWMQPAPGGRPTYPERCLEFDEVRWRALQSTLTTQSIDVCIDTYEYPNVRDQNPLISVTYPEAQAMCESRGRRLCSEDEWTFACEGPETLPYPYGFKRDKVACNIDNQWRAFNEQKLGKRGTEAQRDELARLWQGEPSGTRPDCVSVFGVHDMTGNVDEWTTASRPSKHQSILKGGYWGPVRTRCRPSTRNHGPGHYFYQQGFRCCTNPRSQGESK